MDSVDKPNKCEVHEGVHSLGSLLIYTRRQSSSRQRDAAGPIAQEVQEDDGSV